MPAWGARRDVEHLPLVPFPGAVGGMLGALGGLLFAWAMFSLKERLPWLEYLATLMYAMPVFGILLGSYLGRQWTRHTMRERGKREMDEEALQRVRDVVGGRVRVAGRARAIRFAHTSNGRPCLAVRTLMEGQDAVDVMTAGGEFEIDDGSGALAIVRGEHLKIVTDDPSACEVVVPLDAHVEVVGTARWVTRETEHSSGGLRASPRVLEIIGFEDNPVLLRVRGKTADRSSPVWGWGEGVRVDVGRQIDQREGVLTEGALIEREHDANRTSEGHARSSRE